MKIIGIAGLAGSGKDTFAEMLHEEFIQKGLHGEVIPYAWLLKSILKDYFHWDGKKDEAGRTLLQTVGTDIIREKNPDFWVDFLINMADAFSNVWDYIIIPDVRFENEVTKWHDSKYSCCFLGIRREFESSLTPEQRAHVSEQFAETFIPDIMIDNNTTLDELRESAKTVASHLMP